MDNYIKVRELFKKHIFDPMGTVTTFINKTSITYNDRGEVSGNDTASVSSTLVPIGLIDSRYEINSFGVLKEGEMDIAVPHNTVIDIGTTYTHGGRTYEIKQIERNNYPQNVVTFIRAFEQLA